MAEKILTLNLMINKNKNVHPMVMFYFMQNQKFSGKLIVPTFQF